MDLKKIGWAGVGEIAWLRTGRAGSSRKDETELYSSVNCNKFPD